MNLSPQLKAYSLLRLPVLPSKAELRSQAAVYAIASKPKKGCVWRFPSNPQENRIARPLFLRGPYSYYSPKASNLAQFRQGSMSWRWAPSRPASLELSFVSSVASVRHGAPKPAAAGLLNHGRSQWIQTQKHKRPHST